MKKHLFCLPLTLVIIAGFGIAAIVLWNKGVFRQKNNAEKITAITNVRIFDGEHIVDEHVVVIKGAVIYAVGGEIPEDAAVIDAKGATLLPGLIDSHVHTGMDGLRDALKFGVTTELEMNGSWTARQRKEIAERNDIADMRSSGMGITPKGGHPTEYMRENSNPLLRLLFNFYRYPFVNTPDEAVTFVNKRIDTGADYIKIMMEDGTYIGYPGLPLLDGNTVRAAVDEAHRRDKLVIAHVTTAETARQAVNAGIDGLGHLFFDGTPDNELVADMASSHVFVIPTLATLSTAFGNSAAALASDERVSSRLDKKWLVSLSRSMNVYPHGNLKAVYATVRMLRDNGVDILAGSDVSEPMPTLGGLAHGASLHHELQLLVAAGLEPIEALRAATSVPARRFALPDRGRIIPGALADLLLVEGDPLANIADTLSIRAVWHRGERLTE
jgi:imidazolonepropionase-like amidohydrolase